MLKIGEFSKLSRVSIRMLRHYDEIGLMIPASIDPETGYRYYSAGQLVLMNRIRTLKAMGFSLAAIRDLLEHWDDRDDLERRLCVRRQEVESELRLAAWRMQLLDSAIERLRKDETMSYDVTIKTLPERCAACLRMILPCYEREGDLWQMLRQETAGLGLQFTAPCCGATYYDEGYKETDVDCEVWVTVQNGCTDTEHVRFRALPPVTFASVTYQGSYDQITAVYEAIAAWTEANGYACGGPMFNIYHVSPAQTQNPDEYVTEACCPVQKK